MWKRIDLGFDRFLSFAIRQLLELRRKRRSKQIAEIAGTAISSSDYRFKQRYLAQAPKVNTNHSDPVFFRHSCDVTYVPEALFHVQSPWDSNPVSTHPEISPLIYEWKQLEDASSTAVGLPEDVSKIALETKVELAMHIETLIKHYAKS